jgi:probable HAF family extracellular repeat protein
MFKQLAAAAFCLAAGIAQAASTKWTIVDLGNSFNPIYGGVYATDVNNRGEATGFAYAGASVPQHHAFVWENGTLTDLGVPADSYDSTAYGLNNRGTFVGESGGYIAYLMDGAWTKLGLQGTAMDVNDGDTIVGNYRVSSSGTRAFMLRNGVFMDLGDLGSGYATAYAVNRKDVVVGAAYNAAFQLRPFMYENGVMRDLGTLGGSNAYATDINNKGVVVGYSQNASGQSVAMVYEDGAMRPLLSFGSFSNATSINDRGDIVGSVENHGFLMTGKGELVMLEDLPAVRAEGWQFLFPSAINDRGWIVGQGWHNGQGRSFVLMPK